MDQDKEDGVQIERRSMSSAIWTLDKRIPLPLVLALIGQMAAGIWFAAGVVSKQDQHDRDIASIRGAQSEIRQVSDRLIRLEEMAKNISDQLSKIDVARKIR